MAETEAAPKKGANKIMIVGISLMMLITGGFFGLKMRTAGADKNQATALKLGETDEIHEFLVNLQDSTETGKYLRSDISLQFADGKQALKKDDVDKYSAPLQDAIIAVLSRHSVDEIKTASGKQRLKREIAKAANEALIEAYDSDPAHQGNPMKVLVDHKAPADWDSDSNPVLKVYFTSFAFQ